MNAQIPFTPLTPEGVAGETTQQAAPGTGPGDPEHLAGPCYLHGTGPCGYRYRVPESSFDLEGFMRAADARSDDRAHFGAG